MSTLSDNTISQEHEDDSYLSVMTDDVRMNQTKILDAEYLIREAFNENIDKGIELLFLNYYSILCSHAVRYVISKEVTEDIVSDVFFEFHSKNMHLSKLLWLYTS